MMDIKKEPAKSYYKQINKKIIEKIAAGIYLPNEHIPSERELCDIYSVSRTTIRKAIDELVADGLLIRKPGKGTFVTEKKLSKKPKTGNILYIRCVHSDITKSTSSIKNDIFYPEILAGVEIAATSNNYHCVIRTINENDFTSEQLEESIENTDGIVCAELHNISFFKYLQKFSIPIILVCPSIKSSKVDIVEIDNDTGAYEAVNHLIDHGHKRIAFIGGTETSLPSEIREMGYTKALKNHDINHTYIRKSYWRLEDGYNITLELLKEKIPPTAIFAASDLLAIGAVNAIKDQGLNVPDDISVIGFDDISMSSQMKPALTTMSVRKLEIGKIAAQLLYEKITNKRKYSLKTVVPAELIVRDTVTKLKK